MMKNYETHVEITKELLDSIKVGDLIKINDWKKPLRVMGVSKNYFVMAVKQFSDTVYSACEKTAQYHNLIARQPMICFTA